MKVALSFLVVRVQFGLQGISPVWKWTWLGSKMFLIPLRCKESENSHNGPRFMQTLDQHFLKVWTWNVNPNWVHLVFKGFIYLNFIKKRPHRVSHRERIENAFSMVGLQIIIHFFQGHRIRKQVRGLWKSYLHYHWTRHAHAETWG